MNPDNVRFLLPEFKVHKNALSGIRPMKVGPGVGRERGGVISLGPWGHVTGLRDAEPDTKCPVRLGSSQASPD